MSTFHGFKCILIASGYTAYNYKGSSICFDLPSKKTKQKVTVSLLLTSIECLTWFSADILQGCV